MQIQSEGFGNSQDYLDKLVDWFRQFDSCIVAFSAGVDSTLLAYSAKKALGENAYAVTSLSPSFSEREEQSTRQTARDLGIKLVEVEQDDLGTPDYVKNGVSRCYFCRTNLAHAIEPVRQKLSVQVCVDGTHVDDMKSPRPGIKALREAGFRAPFLELGMGKESVRSVARLVGLPTADRPSEACLSSRIAFGHKIDLETLRRIEAAENSVRRLTGASIVRVRTIGSEASVEVERESVPKAAKLASEITEELQKLGYEKVSIDPDGYTSGKMLELFIKDDS